jgi:hypothetical protein
VLGFVEYFAGCFQARRRLKKKLLGRVDPALPQSSPLRTTHPAPRAVAKDEKHEGHGHRKGVEEQ